MAQCAQCMFENDPTAAACEQCGADLQVEALSMQLGEVCRACDSYNDPGVRVCVSCGQPLGPVATQEAPSEPVEPTPARPWLASPLTPVSTRAVAPAGPGSTAPTLPALAALLPGALPPGWSPPQPRALARGETSRCTRCGAENPVTARFCGSCGRVVAAAPEQAKAKGKLILIRGAAGEGRQFPLGAGPTAAGKGEVPVALHGDPYVSALHATFFFRGDELVVRDEGARNGVYVRLKEPAAVRAGDMFSVGERLLRFGGVVPVAVRSPALHGSPRGAERLMAVEELLEGGGVGRTCRRPGPVLTIGRSGCELNFPQDGYVSARHAELSLAGETAFLRDLGSANGTFLRVGPRAERPLAHGDYLLLGRELLRVEVLQS